MRKDRDGAIVGTTQLPERGRIGLSGGDDPGDALYDDRSEDGISGESVKLMSGCLSAISGLSGRGAK